MKVDHVSRASLPRVYSLVVFQRFTHPYLLQGRALWSARDLISTAYEDHG